MTALLDNPLDDLTLRAIVAALGLALVAGPLGCFVVWRRMAFFGDALAHSALLGVAFALALELPGAMGPAVLVVCLGMAAAMAVLSQRSSLAVDTLLGVLSHAMLAISLVALSFIPGALSPETYLLSSLIFISVDDVAQIWMGATLIGVLLIWRWRRLLNATLSEPLSVAEGGRPVLERLLIMVLLAVFVALAIRIVGVILAASLLVLPAAAARPLARTPEAMALIAAALGALGAVGGVWLSAQAAIDRAPGPLIVAILFALFLLISAGVAAYRSVRKPIRR